MKARSGGGARGHVHMIMTDSHCCMAENNAALQNLKKKKSFKVFEKDKKKYVCKAHSQDLIILLMRIMII